ncbi:MAG: hypothetical protein WCG48_00270 [Candidatus Berkelbacteria bacterium]
MSKNYKKQQQPDIITTIVVGFFKLIWRLIMLPFGGFKKRAGVSADDRAYIFNKRVEIEKILTSESLIELNHAVLEADKLVDFVLKLKGYQGETFADRLRNSQADLSKNIYNDLWEGHKVRNQIAHENELRISNRELREATGKLLEYTKR